MFFETTLSLDFSNEGRFTGPIMSTIKHSLFNLYGTPVFCLVIYDIDIEIVNVRSKEKLKSNVADNVLYHVSMLEYLYQI